MTWNFSEAKDRLAEVVNLALSEGPQAITRRNDTVIVISAAEFAELTGHTPGFKDYLTRGESFEGLDLTRFRSDTLPDSRKPPPLGILNDRRPPGIDILLRLQKRPAPDGLDLDADPADIH